MGRFANVSGAGNGRKGKYFDYYTDPKTGAKITTRWKVRVDKVRDLVTRKQGPAIAIECTVLESTHADYKMGDGVSQLLLEKHEVWRDNFASFIVAAMNLESSKEIDEASCEMIVSAQNPLAGTVLGVEVRHHVTLTNKRDIAVMEWSNAADLDAKMAELAKNLAPAEQEKHGEAAAA